MSQSREFTSDSEKIRNRINEAAYEREANNLRKKRNSSRQEIFTEDFLILSVCSGVPLTFPGWELLNFSFFSDGKLEKEVICENRYEILKFIKPTFVVKVGLWSLKYLPGDQPLVVRTLEGVWVKDYIRNLVAEVKVFLDPPSEDPKKGIFYKYLKV